MDYTRLDLLGVINKFKGLPGAPRKVQAQLQPAILIPYVNVGGLDISSVVDGFKGFAYPYAGIVECPP